VALQGFSHPLIVARRTIPNSKQFQVNAMKISEAAALVTGGGSGLGEATARHLAGLGAKVAVLDLDSEKVTAVASAINGVPVTAKANSLSISFKKPSMSI